MKSIRLLTFALISSVLYVAHGSADVGLAVGGHQAGKVRQVSSSYDSDRKKRKTKKHHNACGRPVLGVRRTVGVLQYSWANASCGKGFRVHVTSAAFGVVPNLNRYTAWAARGATTLSFRVPNAPRAGDGMLGVSYGNPVFAQMQARPKKGKRLRTSAWVTTWPVPPAPRVGDAVRMATYNIEMTRPNNQVAAVARNIATHGVTVVALQEADDDSATAVVRSLGGGWRVSPHSTRTTQQVIYRSDLYDMQSSGTYTVANPRQPSVPLVNPWVELRAHRAVSAASQSFYVATLHITENESRSTAGKYQDNGYVGRQAVTAMKNIDTSGEPVIVAGDFRYTRAELGDRAGYIPAQPTFVRSGYYDAIASRSQHNVNYNTVNGHKRQPTNPSGVAVRADAIMLKGISGSRSYVNVANWYYRGVTPSDHNLVYSDIWVPTR